MHIVISGLQKSSLIDYPEKISAVMFTQGCNFRCPYCHNPELIQAKWKMQNAKCNQNEILEFLKTRVGKLDGVVITGGEPTIHISLPDFIKQIKDLGFAVKLDTNGTNPDMLEQLINRKLIDYVAMDIKAPIEKYSNITDSQVNTDDILASIQILMDSNIDYEFRTTIVKSQLSYDDLKKIASIIKGAKKYYLQRFVPTKTLNKLFLKVSTYTDEEFALMIKDLSDSVESVILR